MGSDSEVAMAGQVAQEGGQYPLREIYEVANPGQGLLFTNNTLPVKIRDWWGVGTHLGIGKSNVV